jgi:hypothetical protein
MGINAHFKDFSIFIDDNFYEKQQSTRVRSSGEVHAPRSTSVTFCRNSGEAALVGGRKRNVGRTPVNSAFAGAGAPAGLKTFAKIITGQ